MCLVHQYVQCVEVFQDNGLRRFYDVRLIPKYTHLEYGVFFKTIILFVFLFDDFYFIFLAISPFPFLSIQKTHIFLERYVSKFDNLI